jgi:erythromycin esterase
MATGTGGRDPRRAEFLEWAGDFAVPVKSAARAGDARDLEALGGMLGDASVVALSEPVHGAAEPLEFRNRALRYLVEQKGFTAVALESGIVESRKVHEFVRGGAGELDTVVAEGVSWTFDELPQNRALVNWLAQYNADPRHTRKVNFYGFDVPGSPANSSARRGMDTAVIETLEYLARVDKEANATFRGRLAPYLNTFHFDFQRPAAVPGYDQLSQPGRDALTAAIVDLVSLFERQEARYTIASSRADYDWAYRAAIGARQADTWLRQIPLGWQPSDEPVRFPSDRSAFLSIATDVRDRAQADNLEWILDQEGPLGKLLVFAHRYHLSSTPVRARWWLPEEVDHQVMGTYLRRRLGKRLVTIGGLAGKGQVECAGFKQTLEPAPPQSMDGLAGEVGHSCFLLDLRSAPDAVARWLKQQHAVGQGGDTLMLEVGTAFDVLFYIDTVRPAGASAGHV